MEPPLSFSDVILLVWTRVEQKNVREFILWNKCSGIACRVAQLPVIFFNVMTLIANGIEYSLNCKCKETNAVNIVTMLTNCIALLPFYYPLFWFLATHFSNFWYGSRIPFLSLCLLLFYPSWLHTQFLEEQDVQDHSHLKRLNVLIVFFSISFSLCYSHISSLWK